MKTNMKRMIFENCQTLKQHRILDCVLGSLYTSGIISSRSLFGSSGIYDHESFRFLIRLILVISKFLCFCMCTLSLSLRKRKNNYMKSKILLFVLHGQYVRAFRK
jgi:hypothetical protein